MKKYCLTALLGALLCAALPTTASAVADGNVNCGTSGTFTIFRNVVTGNTSCVGSVIIPIGVTSIGPNAFRNATSITEVSVPATVNNIGVSAFDGTTGLLSITLGSGVTTIEPFAFYNSSLRSITFGVGVTTIGSGAFFSARSLRSLNFLGPQPSSVNGSAFMLVPTSAKVYVTSENALSFGGVGARWNGFTVELDPTIPPPSPPSSDSNAAAELAAARAREAAREAVRQAALREISRKLSSASVPTLDEFKSADLNGVTESNLPFLAKELLALPEKTRSEEAIIKKFVQKYSYLDQIASGEQFRSITAQQLVVTGIIPAEYRNAVTQMLRTLDPTQRDTYTKIDAAVKTKIAEMEARKARLVATIARHQSRY